MPSPRRRKQIKAQREAAKLKKQGIEPSVAEKKEPVKIQLEESTLEVVESVEVEEIEEEDEEEVQEAPKPQAKSKSKSKSKPKAEKPSEEE